MSSHACGCHRDVTFQVWSKTIFFFYGHSQCTCACGEHTHDSRQNECTSLRFSHISIHQHLWVISTARTAFLGLFARLIGLQQAAMRRLALTSLVECPV